MVKRQVQSQRDIRGVHSICSDPERHDDRSGYEQVQRSDLIVVFSPGAALLNAADGASLLAVTIGIRSGIPAGLTAVRRVRLPRTAGNGLGCNE